MRQDFGSLKNKHWQTIAKLTKIISRHIPTKIKPYGCEQIRQRCIKKHEMIEEIKHLPTIKAQAEVNSLLNSARTLMKNYVSLRLFYKAESKGTLPTPFHQDSIS